MEALVTLDKITKDYGRLRALDNVSLAIGPGITGLLGPNGAGKSTLIKLLLGLVRITGGSGSVLGYRLDRDVLAIRARVGYMPEDDCYLAGLIGVEMVRFAARLSGLPSIEALRRAHEILDFSGIEQERYRPVETYSHGMRQKLKFAQSIVHDPPMLILDEPTSGLDPDEREAMLARIQVLAGRAGKAVLISTHILPDVQSICQNVIILSKGRVQVVDSLEVLRRPASPTYHLRVLGPPEVLAERIRREGFDVQTEEGGRLVLAGGSQDALAHVWRWAQEAGVSIRALAPAKNSMEQIFLNAVREDQHANP
jgi:ABC-2 type transport system ATP-binding protein